MTERREFLASLAALGLPGVLPRTRGNAPQVEVHNSVFFSHPNGEQNLVRFSVTDTDAPAGRLRLYDGRRRLLGTAGLINVGGRLYGELWVPLATRERVTSEVETPGSRSPMRSTHVLNAPKRWTLHWLTVVEPDSLRAEIETWPALELGVGLAILRHTHVTGNPYRRDPRPPEILDHVDFLRSAAAARQLERRYGLPSSPVAVADARTLRMQSAPLALAGAGVSYAILLDDEGNRPFHMLQSRDGSRIIAASPLPGSDPRGLGFTAGRDTMARRVESWLTDTVNRLGDAYAADSVFLVSTGVEDERAAMLAAVADWNGRFAFPQIVTEEPRGMFERLAVAVGGPASSGAVEASTVIAPGRPPDTEAVRQATANRTRDRDRRFADLFAPLNRLLGSPEKGPTGLADAMQASFGGAIVVNVSPVTRTDTVSLPGGTETLVPDVPPLGYVYLPDLGPRHPPPRTTGNGREIRGAAFTVRVNGVTGSVASLYEHAADREWITAGADGFNDLLGARLERVERVVLPEIGERLVVRRSTPRGELVTHLTVYERLPWLDIDNVLDVDVERAIDYRFPIALENPMCSWETPAGFEERAELPGTIAHLRWVQLADPRARLRFRAVDAPYVSLERGASDAVLLRAHAMSGRSRFRFQVSRGDEYGDEPWTFGWGAEPFGAFPVSGRGTTDFPGYGHLMRPSVGALIVGLKEADDGDGIIVYLQDVLGYARNTTIRGGVLRFGRATPVDLVERTQGEPRIVLDDTVEVAVAAHGVSAIRLSDLHLEGG